MKLELVEREVNSGDPNTREIDLYVDSETGVQYFVMNTSNAGAICPRYDADGNLYVSVTI